MERGVWQAAAHGVTQSQTRLKQLSMLTQPDILWNDTQFEFVIFSHD